MPRLPPSPNIRFDNAGLLHGEDFNDTYFSRDDGLAETRAVFLAGNKLPDAWAGRTQFVIGELGFGTGLNILATWALWQQTAPAGATLHIITVEGFLLDRLSAQTAHAAWPELAPLSEKLIARWPTRSFGTQRIWFMHDRVCITFLIGPCEEMLAAMSFNADCWFLDGFAPSKNPQMWSPAVLQQVARLSNPNATIATYSVAGAVRKGLSEGGFDVQRVPGFGSKRERLEGMLSSSKQSPDVAMQGKPQSAMIIGGGIGGAALCDAMARRGIAVELVDPDPCGRIKASGNPVALIMPRLDKADTREARFFRCAYLMACDHYVAMPSGCFDQTGVIEYGEDAKARARLVDLLDDPPFPETQLGGGENETLVHLAGGSAYPDAVLTHLKGQAARHPLHVDRLLFVDNHWCAYALDGTLIARADICVIAAGTGVGRLCDFGVELGGRAGQLSLARVKGTLPKRPISGGGYAMGFGERLCFGATFERWDIANEAPPPVTTVGHLHNRNLLAEFVPELASRIDLGRASGRTSIRVTTPDQLPIAGRAPGSELGLYVLAGLGSRGFTTSFLCAELIASMACGEPLPLENQVVEAIAPDRFINRKAKRRRLHTDHTNGPYSNGSLK